jgi:hypothetical protein
VSDGFGSVGFPWVFSHWLKVSMMLSSGLAEWVSPFGPCGYRLRSGFYGLVLLIWAIFCGWPNGFGWLIYIYDVDCWVIF